MKKVFQSIMILTAFAVLFVPNLAQSHCQIPCGIYDDEARFTELLEHCTTIEKSMKEINKLSADGDKNYNQLVRWVNNKEQHADKLADIVVDYFMVQRIKEVASGMDGYQMYLDKVTVLHKILRTAMKCKQTTDIANVTTMRQDINNFKEMYSAK